MKKKVTICILVCFVITFVIFQNNINVENKKIETFIRSQFLLLLNGDYTEFYTGYAKNSISNFEDFLNEKDTILDIYFLYLKENPYCLLLEQVCYIDFNITLSKASVYIGRNEDLSHSLLFLKLANYYNITLYFIHSIFPIFEFDKYYVDSFREWLEGISLQIILEKENGEWKFYEGPYLIAN